MNDDASLPTDAQAALTRASAALHVAYQELANAAHRAPTLTPIAEVANDIEASRRSIEQMIRPPSLEEPEPDFA